jgi:predicted DNA-binding transcriptional regulator YafY
MAHEVGPTARALLALETIQNTPGISADRLGARLGVTERAARRYVAILRAAGLPIDSVSGPYGGYQVGHGLRLPPLTFTAAEAAGLVMAVLEGHRPAADPADLVGGALAKIVRVLPGRVASLVLALRESAASSAVAAAGPGAYSGVPVSPELTTALIEACADGRRLRLGYRSSSASAGGVREMTVDPWAVLLRHSRWYLLCWSHTAGARRVLRVDRVVSAELLPETSRPPSGLDAMEALEEHLSAGWRYPVSVVIDAPVGEVRAWLPRSLGALSPCEAGQPEAEAEAGTGAAAGPGRERTRLAASTSDPQWYAGQLAVLPFAFTVDECAQLRQAVADLGRRLLAAADSPE